MSAVIVTAKDADALVSEAPNAGLTATILPDGRVRVASPIVGDAEDLAFEMSEYAYRFGITKIENDEKHGEDVDDYSMCICGRPMDGHEDG